MFKNVVLGLTALAVIFFLGLVAGVVGHRFFPLNGISTLNTPTILTRVQTLNHLVTVKYVLEKVVVHEDAQWYGNNRVLLVAHGVVKAGIDLSQLKKGDFQIHEKQIVLTLPPARITDVYLDDQHTQVLERSTGLLRSFDKNLEQSSRVEAEEDLRRAAAQSGILPDATDRAKLELSGLFYQLGFTSVEFHPR